MEADRALAIQVARLSGPLPVAIVTDMFVVGQLGFVMTEDRSGKTLYVRLMIAKGKVAV